MNDDTPPFPRAAPLRHWGACALLTLAGCASMAPPYEAPDLPVPADYPDDAPRAASENSQPVAATGWRDYFADPQLRALIEAALDNNRDLRLAVLRAEEARAAYGIQRADLLPTLGANAEATRSRTPADLSFTGQPLVGSSYQVNLGVSAWELDFWGRVRSLNDAALQSYLASDAARQAATVNLVRQVADGWLALREYDERIALARATVASRAESLRIFSRRVQVGSTSRLDLIQVETLLTQAQTLGAQLEQARAQQAHALALLVGAPVDLRPLPQSQPGADAPLPPLRAGLPSELLAQRPDIVAAEHQLRAAHASIGAARAAFFPNVRLTAALGTASAELDGLFASGSQAWSFAPSLSLPLFDGGRNQANLDLAWARRNQAVARYEQTVQTAFREVADALAAQQWLATQVGIQQTELAAQTERARLAKLRYDNGAAPFLDVLDSQRSLLAAEQQLAQTRRALLSSRVSLYAALGGGPQDTAPAIPSPSALPTH
ncbi:MAG TPA: efflux transporter outer membrane subunit [Burkholderiaceae bacterium]